MPISRETLVWWATKRRPPRLVTSRSGIDRTEQMRSWAAKKVREPEQENLCVFIFKKDSFSSGLYRVKVHSVQGMPRNSWGGIFARAFTRNFPLLPVEEEGRLNDARLRENFIATLSDYSNPQANLVATA